MKYKHAKTDWKELLPPVFSWLDDIKTEAQKTFEPGAHYIIPFEKDDQKEAVFHCGLLGEDFTKDAQLTLKTLGTKHTRAMVCLVRGAPVVFVPVSKLDVAISQKGRQIGLDAASCLKGLKVEKVVVCDGSGLDCFDIFDGLVQGWYEVIGFKEAKSGFILPPWVNFSSSAYDTGRLKNVVSLLKAMCLSRMVADAPPNWMTSEMFAEIAQTISKDLGLKCKVWGREEILQQKMGAFHSVGQGTYIDPKFISIEIEGVNTQKCVSLVGKGLTFDSGGISLKPPAGMSDMKYDMCGGAAVLGAAYYLGLVKPPTNVVCLIGAVENMPGVYATRPGDIVHSRSSKTIEVLNTDAEGRLVLADLLHYVTDVYKPDFVIDVATLTGAVLFALGSIGSAVLSNKQELCDYLVRVSKTQGEPLWQLPMWPELDQELKSEVADLKNIVAPSVKAGTITAAVFLKQFVGDTPWAHIDIAGTGWDCKATGFPKTGGTAFSLRTLTSACLNWESK